MYLLYIDDSGTCELKNNADYSLTGGNTRYFVLGAILITAHNLNEAQTLIDTFHCKCLKNELSEIKYSPTNKDLNCKTSCSLEKLDKNCYRSEIADLITHIKCTIFTCAQDKYYTTQNHIINSKADTYRLSFEHLLKLIDTYMYENKINEDIIVFIDHKDNGYEKDDLIFKAYKDALKNNRIYKSFGNGLFAPSINVVSSRHTVGAQLADFIAGSIWKFYESMNDKTQNLLAKEITHKLGQKIYRGIDGKQKSFTFCKTWLQ